MSIEKRASIEPVTGSPRFAGQSSGLAEFRIVCDSCHEATEWTEDDIPADEVADSCLLDALGDGRHVCSVCQDRVAAGMAVAAVAAATGLKLTPDEVVEQADNLVGDERAGSTAGKPLAGQSFSITGRIHAPNGSHIPREEAAAIIRALGGVYTPNAAAADVLLRGDTGVHGNTHKVRTARSNGAEVRDVRDFWAALGDRVDPDGCPRADAARPKKQAKRKQKAAERQKRSNLPTAAAVEELKRVLSSAVAEFDDLDDI